MTIRAAASADIPAIVNLGKTFFEAAAWSRFADWHEESISGFLRALIEGPLEGAVIVAETDGEIVGIAALLCFPFYFNFGVKAAQELFMYAHPGHRNGVGDKLRAGLEQAARDKGATVIVMSAVQGMRSDALARSYRRQGYSVGEITFMKRLTS